MPASTWSHRNHWVSLFPKLPGASVPSQFHLALTTPASEREATIRREREREREREGGRVGEEGRE